MSAAFMLILGIVFVYLAVTGRWKAMLSTIQKPPDAPVTNPNP